MAKGLVLETPFIDTMENSKQTKVVVLLHTYNFCLYLDILAVDIFYVPKSLQDSF